MNRVFVYIHPARFSTKKKKDESRTFVFCRGPRIPICEDVTHEGEREMCFGISIIIFC